MKIIWLVMFWVKDILWVISSMVWCLVVNCFISVNILLIYFGFSEDVGLLNRIILVLVVMVWLIFICCCWLLDMEVG